MQPCGASTHRAGHTAAMSTDNRHIVLAGATGYIGRAVAERLAQLGLDHTLLQRRPADEDETVPGRRVVVTEFGEAESLRQSLASTPPDIVISCLASRSGVSDDAWAVDYAANSNLLKASEALGASHFILLSAICVQKPGLAFQHAKLAFEKELMDSGMRYSIVRPTAFFRSLSGQIERVRNGKPFLVFGDGRLTACKPIGEADLAAYMIDCISDPDRYNRVLPIGGPGDALTPMDQASLLFRLMDREPTISHVPVGILSVASALLSVAGWLVPAARTKAELARIGRYYATESMLLWDESRQAYDADATPSTGTRTLEDHYRHVLSHGIDGHEAGEHRLFD